MSQGLSAVFKSVAVAFALACCVLLAAAAPGFAAGPKFAMEVETANYEKEGQPAITNVYIQNVGGEETHGPIFFTATFGPGSPPPVIIRLINTGAYEQPGEPTCETVGQTVSCEMPWILRPGVRISMAFSAVAIEGFPSRTATFSLWGGGTVGVNTQQATTVVGQEAPFDFSQAAAELFNADGSTAVQAGSDPASFTTHIHLLTEAGNANGVLIGSLAAHEHFKDVTVSLPEGFIGNPRATAKLCTAGELASNRPGLPGFPGCPAESQVGTVWVGTYGPLYNMVPPPGVASELGFQVLGVVVLLEAYLRPGDHGINVVSRNTSTGLPVAYANVTVWGVPSDPSHDYERDICTEYEGGKGETCPSSAPRKAFLRLPTECPGTPLGFEVSMNSYEHPETFLRRKFTSPAVQGCDVLPFGPGISVFPTGTAADSPTGLSVRVTSPQNDNPDGLAEADLKKAVVTLPEGMAINPSAADGLQACTDEQLRLGSNVPADCPDGSKIGTVLLHTPLLENAIEGNLYLRTQNSSDPESGEMYRMAMELRDDRHGIDIKVPGAISVNKLTGRLTTTFDDNPQLPFSDVTLSIKAGARAPLTTPESCQPQTTEADLYSWAVPNVAVHSGTTFALTSGPEGTPCVAQRPFDPGFDAGVSSVQAGAFTPFLATFTRKDADQGMQRVSVKMPEGLLGSLTGLPLCGEAQANAGTCPQASEIGSVTAGAGSGPTPFYVTGGKVFMTGPYEGAPFGLSVVVPAKAGPFDLGTVVVRSKVEVDIHTAQLTVTTDPLPQIVGGVPVNLRLVNVTINRPNFTYNPTDCDPTTVDGTMTGGQGATATIAKHFQVTNCGALGFKPKFKVSTSGKTSRAKGASLTAKLTYPYAPQGAEANIAKVKVSLPKQLPSRLTTLQKACPAPTFETNPAACPPASKIGTATTVTPVVPVPLNGPVYFVSHGGEAFPDLVVVLQGYGVTVDLVGTTFISKAGITSTTFKQVPDVPVGTFRLELPQGPYSALAANGNLCTKKLSMPTTFIAHNGAAIHVNTPIAVTHCAKAHNGRRHARHKKGKKK